MDSRIFPGTGRIGVAIAVVVINAVAIAIVAFALFELYDRNLKDAEVQSRNLALALSQTVANEIDKIDLSLSTVASELDRQLATTGKIDLRSVQASIRRQKIMLPEVEGWSITDLRGQVMLHDSGDIPPGLKLGDRDYFRELASGRRDGLVISKLLTSRYSGGPVVVLARAFRDRDGEFAGIVVVALPQVHLERLLGDFTIGPEGLLALRDEDLALITRVHRMPGMPPRLEGDTRHSVELGRHVAAGEPEATFTDRSAIDGIERIWSYRRLEQLPVYAVAGISKADSLEDWYPLAGRFVGLLALFVVMTTGSGVLLVRFWRRQQHAASALEISNERLAGSLRQLRERDNALVSAQEAGALGTYTLEIASGLWTSSELLDALFGIDGTYPHTVEGWRELIHPEDRQWMISYFRDEVVGRRQLFDREYRIRRPADGRIVWVHGLGKLELDESGEPVRMSGTIQDVSARKFAEVRLRLADEVFQNAAEGVMVTDRDGTIIETNPAFTLITGYAQDEALGQTPRFLRSGAHDAGFYQAMWRTLAERGEWTGEFVNRHKDGRLYTVRSRISAIRDSRGDVVRYAGVMADVTEIRESQRRLEYMAYYDELTKLPNRRLFADRIRQAMAKCRRDEHATIGVCCLDLDGFKEVNDELGHQAGDQLLIEVANRLQRSTRACDTVARLGGDEFVILFEDLEGEADLSRAVTRLSRACSETFPVGERQVVLTASIGVTTYPADPSDEPDVLLRHADQAMYEAKRRGRNRWHCFDLESDRRLQESHEKYVQVARALERNELVLYYQPKVELRSGAVVGAEALLRWQHPEHGLLQPGDFLSAIETTELTLPVGEWILHRALQQIRAWRQRGIELPVSVNVFGLHLQRADFVDRLRDILREYPEVPPERLKLEILETTALEDLDAITERLLGCKALGVSVALDDFGTGYSSLTYLRQLPVDEVKIDRSFVREIGSSDSDQAMVQGIVNMAHALSRKVVAEGVETTEHGSYLLHCGCDLAQGYGIARPMPAKALEHWLAHWRMPDAWQQALHQDVLYFGRVLA